MRARAGALAIGLLVALTPAARAGADQGQVERPFKAGQRLWMDLSAGAYRIQPGADDRIVVRWDARSGSRKASVDVQVRAGDATLVTDTPRNSETRFVIEVPSRTDLTVRLSAGELRIAGITGNKDVSLWAGDVDVEVSRPNDYKVVRANVTVGDLSAPDFDTKTGGFFRSLSWDGRGNYRLDVRLTAGQIRLRREVPRVP